MRAFFIALMSDPRSQEAKSYRRLYKTKAWQQLRQQCFIRDLYTCQHCGCITRKPVCDHIKDHKGDTALFHSLDNLRTTCKPCHDRHSQREAHGSKAFQIGSDGWPTEYRHPVNSGTKKQPFSIPNYILPSAIPVHLVCGAPGSGKTTYVRANAQPGDTIIDFDDIRERLGVHRYDESRSVIARTFRERDRMLHELATKFTGEAWFIVMAPTDREREAWKQALGKVTIHSIDTDKAECKRRILADPTRKGAEAKLLQAIDRYFGRRQANRH